MENKELKIAYDSIATYCKKAKHDIVELLEEGLDGVKYVDSISGRVKAKNSFMKKYSNAPEKYKSPFKDIEDLIGIRILVICRQASENVIARISDGIFSKVENKYKQPEKSSEFGYEGHQLIFSIPEGLMPTDVIENPPQVFEIQVKTLYMHAWAQGEHKIRYKKEKDLPVEINRKISWLAANSWGADEILSELMDWHEKDN